MDNSHRKAVITTPKGSTAESSTPKDHSSPGEDSFYPAQPGQVEKEPLNCISVGEELPYGPRMYYESSENVVRMKDIGVQNRILLIGVIGSFTPDCWNRHLFQVLQKVKYYEERGIDFICCLSTNDAFTQRAWGDYLGCSDSVLMWSDSTKKFTKAIGMDLVIPWLDNNVRSRRYIIYAEDMTVSKMIVSPNDGPNLAWNCEHIQEDFSNSDDIFDDMDNSW